MNEEYQKLKKRIEYELNNEYRALKIAEIVIKYYGISRKIIIGDNSFAPVVFVRQMISYVACSIYGVPAILIAKQLNYKRASVYTAIDAIKDKLPGDRRIHSDLENIRAELAKVLNG